MQVARCMTEFLREHQTLGCWVPQDHSGVWRMIMVLHLSPMRACAIERERERREGVGAGRSKRCGCCLMLYHVLCCLVFGCWYCIECDAVYCVDKKIRRRRDADDYLPSPD